MSDTAGRPDVLDRIEQWANIANREGKARRLRGHARSTDRAPGGGYLMEMNPDDVLALVRVARAARDYVEKYECSTTDLLDEALAELLDVSDRGRADGG